MLPIALCGVSLSEWSSLNGIHKSVPSKLRGTQYRHLVIPPLRIFYRQQKDIVYIVHVMRGERQFREDDLLEQEDHY
jgi:hypothetical protein